MLITQDVPPWIDLVLKVCTPLGAALAFFFGLLMRGKLNDKAIADLTLAVTDLTKVTHSLDKAVSVLSNTCENISEDTAILEGRVDKNSGDISFIQGQQSVRRLPKGVQ